MITAYGLDGKIIETHKEIDFNNAITSMRNAGIVALQSKTKLEINGLQRVGNFYIANDKIDFIQIYINGIGTTFIIKSKVYSNIAWNMSDKFVQARMVYNLNNIRLNNNSTYHIGFFGFYVTQANMCIPITHGIEVGV